MKHFLVSKLNIILGLLLATSVGLSGYIIYNIVRQDKTVTVPDFLAKNINQTYEWCGELDPQYACTIVYEDSDTVSEGVIINQSLPAGSIMNGTMVFTVSTGKTSFVILPTITANTTKADIEAFVSANSLLPAQYIDENSDSVPVGSVIRLEPNDKIDKNSTLKVYISIGPKQDDSSSTTGTIIVKSGTYNGLTVTEFETKVKALGLVPNHNTSRDATSSTVTKGNIVWHGSGEYEKGETINYGVCTEKTSSDEIVITSGSYVGKTEEEYKKYATGLGLVPNHNTEWDAYSDTVAKGNIVKHGAGTYEKGEKTNYGLSLGKEGDSSSTEIKVTSGQYVGKTEDEFKTIATNLGLKATHLTSRDAYSDTVAKGNIVTHGYGTYEKGEAFNYGLSLGKKDSSPSTIYITPNSYVGKTETDYINYAKGLGLVPNHKTEWDDYSDTIAKGSIVKHGQGEYEKGETTNYGLSLGKKDSSSSTITITANSYVGKSESEYINYAKGLGLVPNHNSSWDAYSSSVSKGNIVKHGSGTYTKGETTNYGLSLGPEPQVTKVTVTSKAGSTESEFISYLTSLGLKAGTKSTDYSSTYGEGTLISNDTGTFTEGSSVNYKVSLGTNTGTLLSKSDLASQILSTGDYEAAKNKMITYLDNQGFTNYTINGQKSTDYGAGVLLSITVNGSTHTSASVYPVDVPIVVTICNGMEES